MTEPEVEYALTRLANARAKLSRAKLHIEVLRLSISEAGQGEPYTIPLREDLDPDTGTLYLRVDRETARPEQWGLFIGDALHNLRSALDSGWWQLARHHLRREPTEDEAKQIQFPILKPGGTWDPGNYRSKVGTVATKFVGEVQPDPRGYAPELLHPLAALRTLSNIDKHRNIHTTVHQLGTLELKFTAGGQQDGDGAKGFTINHFGDSAPKAGDEVLTIPADSILRNPHAQFEAHQTGFVAIEGGRMSAVATLNAIHAFADSTLAGFSHILAGKVPPTPQIVLGPDTDV